MRAHGTRARYVFGPVGRGKGCRCDRCTEAQRTYARDRYRAMHRPDGNFEPACVSTAPARAHLEWLSAGGVGRRAVSARSGLAESTLQRVRNGTQTRARRATVEAILGVGLHAAAPGALVDAAETWSRIDDLRAAGWTKRAIARHLTGDPATRSLQLSRRLVEARNARAVEQLHLEVLGRRVSSPRYPWGDVSRLPLAPLEARVCVLLGRAGLHVEGGDGTDPCLASVAEVAVCCGVNERLWHRWREAGGIPAPLADDVAAAAGFHPVEVWPDFHLVVEAAA